jgi:hypothetical protein
VDKIEKIGKLLKQAEGASTPEEAAVFTEKAQGLATQYSVDLAVARQRASKHERRETPVQKTIHWGSDLGTRNTKTHLVELFSRIAGNNDVRLNIYHDSSGVIAFGFPTDIEVTETLFASLAIQMVEAGDKYIRSGEYKSETVYRSKRVPNPYYDASRYGYHWGEPKTIEEWGHFPVDGRTARANFYQGFISEIGTRLRKARTEAEAQAIEAADADLDVQEDGSTVDSTPGAALVLVEKRREVQDFYRSTSNARGSWKGSSAGSHSGSRSAGQSAGRNARLSSQTSIGGGRTAIA